MDKASDQNARTLTQRNRSWRLQVLSALPYSLLLTACIGFTPSAWAVFKCELPDGSISFQQGPCARPAPPLTIIMVDTVDANTTYQIEDELTSGRLIINTQDVAETPTVTIGGLIELAPTPQLTMDVEGLIPLAAIMTNDLGTVAEAIANGVDINGLYPTDAGAQGTALKLAFEHQSWEVFEFLLRRGADVNKVAPGTHSLLAIAAANGSVNTLEKLVRHGARLEADFVGEPLIIAAKAGHVDAVAFLLTETQIPNLDSQTLWNTLIDELYRDLSQELEQSVIDAEANGQGEIRTADPMQYVRQESLKDVTELLMAFGEEPIAE